MGAGHCKWSESNQCLHLAPRESVDSWRRKPEMNAPPPRRPRQPSVRLIEENDEEEFTNRELGKSENEFQDVLSSTRGKDYPRSGCMKTTVCMETGDDDADDFDLATRSTNSSRHCSSCEDDNTSEDSFASEIAKFFSFRPPAATPCATCGKVAMRQAKYCSECGSAIASVSTTTTDFLVSQDEASSAPLRVESEECDLPSPSSSNTRRLRHAYRYTVKISYRDKGVLGIGASGKVYTAIDVLTGQPLAVKKLHVNLDNEAEVKAIRCELKHLFTLQHPNIVEYMGCLVNKGAVFFLMERIECGSLQDMLKQFPSGIPESAVRSFTRQVLNAISYVHECGVTHRDIKPGNILVGSDGVIKIADFGSAIVSETGENSVISLRKVKIAGTPLYMPPESLEVTGRRDVDVVRYGKVHDVWSIGCSVHQLLTGESPWVSLGVTNPYGVLMRIRNRPFPVSHKLSPLAKSFLQYCFIVDPLERASAAYLLNHPFIKED